MSEEEVYTPVFALCAEAQTVWQDLCQCHGVLPAQIDGLSETAAWRWHDALREASLGRAWAQTVYV